MKTDIEPNNSLLIILDTESDTMLFPNHHLRVEFGWKYMLDQLKLDSQELTEPQKEQVMGARSLINQYQKSADKELLLQQFNEKYHLSLTSLPRDPKGLIRQSLGVLGQVKDDEVDQANILYLNGFIKSLEQAELGEVSDLAKELSTLDQKYKILRAPHKREKIPSTPIFELMDHENNELLNFKHVINFGILEDGSRKNNLQEIIDDHKECYVVVSPKELERINDILTKPNFNEEINSKIIVKIKDKKICVIGECNFMDFPKIKEHFSECLSFSCKDFKTYLDDPRSKASIASAEVLDAKGSRARS